MYKETVKEYFKNKAEEYDLTDDQVYWVLSDNLLWHILQNQVLNNLGSNLKFVDAGAGTGRWSKKILENYQGSEGLMLDLSAEMLQQAINKLEKINLIDQVTIKQCDLDIYDEEAEKDKYDIAYSFHNVLGFVKNPKEVIRKMYSMVKPGGYVVCGVPNFYHNLFFNIFVQNMELADECYTTKKGRFTSDMPAMNLFTPESLKDIYKEIGIKTQGVYGFPVSIYPGMQETQLRGQTQQLSDILSDKNNFNKIFEMEKQLYLNEEAASRGNQLIIIGRK